MEHTNVIVHHLQKGSTFNIHCLYQYDYGQRLVFKGANLPFSYEVHFSNEETGESKTVIGDETGVDIPDEFLLSGEPLLFWIYLHDGPDDGETEYRGKITIIKRAKPIDIEPTPVQQDVITQTIAHLDAAVSHVDSAVEGISDTIDAALQEAKDSGEFDGLSPTAVVSKSGSVSTLSVTDREGTTTTEISDGLPGADGFSPIATVTKTGGTATISITDRNGTTTATVSDGGAAGVIDDTAGAGTTDKTWSADKLTSDLSEKADKTNTVLNTTLSRGRKENTTVGEKSVAFGTNVTASGPSSQAYGSNTIASGSNAHAEGYGGTFTISGTTYTSGATGGDSHSEGHLTSAAGWYSHSEGSNTLASGDGSHAEGGAAIASGNQSHAEGGLTVASESQSHAEGYKSNASGGSAHAEGRETISSGSYAHAEGYSTTSSGTASHAEGYSTKATMEEAHSEGRSSQATGKYAHAENYLTTASGESSHAEGNQTTASGKQSHVEGYHTTAYGANSHVIGTYNVDDNYDTWPEWVSGTGYVVGDKVKRTTTNNDVTTITGYICKTANSDASFISSKWTNQEGRTNYVEIVGIGTGNNAKANARTLDWNGNERLKGDLYINCNVDSTGGTAMTTLLGSKADANNPVFTDSISMGRKANTTVGFNSVAVGYDTTASGPESHSEGATTVASGAYAHAEGCGGTYTVNGVTYTSAAVGISDHVEGYQCLTASNQPGNHAEGYQTSATGGAAHAEGSNGIASGNASHSEGNSTKATGYTAHSEGMGTIASASYSHAENENTTASGTSSHAEGSYTTASGVYSHSEGASTIASGAFSHAQGNHTIAAGRDSSVLGHYNVADNIDGWPEWEANKSYFVGDKVKHLTNGTMYGYVCKYANSSSVFNAGNWDTAELAGMNYAEIVGNGSYASRSNARALDWDGNERLMGDVYVGCNADSSGGSKLIAIPEPPTIDGNYILKCVVSGGVPTMSWVSE